MAGRQPLASKAIRWLLPVVLSLLGLALAMPGGPSAAETGNPPVAKKTSAPAAGKPDSKPAAPVLPPPAPGDPVTYIPPYDSQGALYVLLAWSDSGMRLVSDCDQFFSLGAPWVNLRAQLVKRGQTPALVSQGVVITYAVERMADPAAKSRFWELSTYLTGHQLSPGQGPGGLGQRGSLSAGDKIFSAEGIPLLPWAADGFFMPYPTVALEARDAQSGQVLAMTRAVLPVTTQLGCAMCHGGAQPGLPGISSQTASNILAAHDKISGGKLLAEAKAGHPRSCNQCHGAGKKELSVSASLHGFHAGRLPGQGAQVCSYCHPGGPPTSFFRGVHHSRGLDCARCHGLLEDHALGLLKAEAAAGKPKDAQRLMAGLQPRAGEVGPRTAWVQEPNCKGCHDFEKRPGPDARSMGVWNQDPANIYHLRRDQAMGLACAACHGTAHAIYPAQSPLGRDRDNIQPMQYMGWAKSMGGAGKCGVCHLGNKVNPQTPVHHPLPPPVGTVVSMAPDFSGRMPGVRFPHQAHAGENCQTCHHKGYADGEKLTCSAAACHDRTSGEEDPRYFRNAFHGKGFSCNYCHQQRRKAGQAAGPVECGGCHTIAR